MSPEIEKLLRDEGWVRELARRLVRDGAAEDDLLQEAWLAARKRPPGERSEAGLRRWVGVVLRNRARQERRSGVRRQAREHARATPEAVAGPAELLERLELREQVVRAVRELGEPYRTAILLRWFEGLAPREIAARHGVPTRTVHSWLARGLEQLRARLRRELGRGRGSGLFALLPLCDPPAIPAGALPLSLSTHATAGASTSASTGASIGTLVMTANTKLALTALAAAALVTTYFALPQSSGARPLEPVALMPAEARPDVLEGLPESAEALGSESAGREAVATAAPEPDATPERAPAALEPFVARGRVVDVADRPVSGLPLALVAGDGEIISSSESASDGTYALDLGGRPWDRSGVRLRIEDPRWTPVLEPGNTQLGSGVLVVAPRVELGGVVQDEHGRPLSGARVRIGFDSTLRTRFTQVLDRARGVDIGTSTDEAGRFELPAVPSTVLARLRVEHPGRVPHIGAIPSTSTWELVIELAPREAEVLVLSGRVLDVHGAPLDQAWVALDGKTTRSQADGSFVLEVREPGASGILWAAVAGHAPARLERNGASNLDRSAWPEPLELVVTGAAGAIRGRVLDSTGEPVPDATVRLSDPTEFGAIPFEGQPDLLVGSELESLLAGRMYSYGAPTTDAEGRFELAGLTDREYSVEVVDPIRLARATFQLVPSAVEVELRLPETPPPRRVAGRVVYPDGTPAAGASVVLQSQPHETSGLDRIEGARANTAEDGTFEFPRASAAAVGVGLIRDDGTQAGRISLLPAGEVSDLELVLARLCHLQVVLTDPAEATEFRLLDAAGEPLQALHQQANIMWGQERIDLVEGRSQAVRVEEFARELLLYKDGEELRRVPVELVPGELNTVRP